MSFSEKTKIEVKEKAAFRCCRCQSVSVQVHHIIPEEAGGADTIDNAAPLCPSCHNAFGGNPEKRKEIKQMRDW
jgi:5-methylcytosine-specific restriction endonuclease McrA